MARARRYVAYYRVSTGRQRLSGLGLDAQREAAHAYIASNPGRLVAEYSEALSGRKNDRPKLDAAIRTCRLFRATLVIARLDRLSRNLEMISRLMESGLEFVAVDFPHANRFTIHILAAVAEYESNLNSERMKVVLAAAKARGALLGRQRRNVTRAFPPGSNSASNRVRQARADARARDLAPIVWRLIAEGRSYREIANELNIRRIPSPNRRGWYANAIFRIVQSTADEFGTSPEAKSARSAGPRAMKVMLRNREVGPLLLRLRADGASLAAMAVELDERRIKPPRGEQWSQVSIWRYLKRAMNVSALRAPRKPIP